jgi:GNAT superfamily N-acetyltransferase
MAVMCPAPASPDLINDIDVYLDAAPRPDSDAVAVGPFTLFVSRTPWAYYARPTVGQHDAIASADLDALAAACAERGVRLSIEWVHEVHPELAEVAAVWGLDVRSHVLMSATSADVAAPQFDGVTVRIADAGDPAVAAGRAVADVAFTAGGTRTGPEGATERDTSLAGLASDLVAHLYDRARRGLTITAVAESPTDGVVAVGSYHPMGEFAEVLAVATLPAARRRGLAGALTATLARHAFGAGVQTVVLSAQDDVVANVYARVGFRPVGTAHAAEPAE